jgi:hypothetical protein
MRPQRHDLPNRRHARRSATAQRSSTLPCTPDEEPFVRSAARRARDDRQQHASSNDAVARCRVPYLVPLRSRIAPGVLNQPPRHIEGAIGARHQKGRRTILWCHTKPNTRHFHHITSHHITSHHITSHHITSHHITSHHITSYHITSHHITSHHITSHHITSQSSDVTMTNARMAYTLCSAPIEHRCQLQ